jgi:hypothetical protein
LNQEDYLKNIENNNETYIELKKFINECNGEFILMEADQKKGYKFGYVLYMPHNIKGKTLILHGNNCAYEEGNILIGRVLY